MFKIEADKGQTFVEGRSQKTAAKLIEAAKELDLVREVRTSSRGYFVPNAVAEAAGFEVKVAEEEAEETEETAEETEETEEVEGDKAFDPSEHNVDEVTAYLEGADDEERNRVLAAEAEGKARATLIGKN